MVIGDLRLSAIQLEMLNLHTMASVIENWVYTVQVSSIQQWHCELMVFCVRTGSWAALSLLQKHSPAVCPPNTQARASTYTRATRTCLQEGDAVHNELG